MINQDTKLSIYKKLGFIILAILCIIPTILAILHQPIDPDSGYYLAIVERMNEGFKPYIDFLLPYTPLYFYTLLFLKKMFVVGINYEFYMTIHFITLYISAYFVYKISQVIHSRNDYAFYSAVLFIIASHWNQGNDVLLEIPSIMFGLISIYLTFKYLNKSHFFILIGIFAALSFLTKQYGLGFLFLIIILILFNKYKYSQLLYLIIGFILPILIFYVYFGNSLMEIVSRSYGMDISFSEKIEVLFDRTIHFFKRIFPSLLIGFIFLPFIINKKDKNTIKFFILLIISIMGFMLQFYFAPFTHYYLYVLPFASILSFYILNQINRFKWVYIIALSLTVFLSFYSTYYNRVYKIYVKNPELKENQYKLSAEILKSIENKTSSLYVGDIGLVQQYYLTNLIPPNFSKYGYSFGIATNEETYLKQIKSADYILKTKLIYKYDYNSTFIDSLLNQRCKVLENNQIILYN